MGRNPRRCVHSLWCGILLALLVSCGSSPPTHFHVLTAIGDPDPGKSTAGDLTIGVGPVDLPGYLDRPQIVTRSGGTDLELAEFNQWAESLRVTFLRVFGENLSTLVSTDRVHIHPWGGAKVDYAISVDVTRFEAVGDGSVVLAARWSLSGEDGDTLPIVKKVKFTVKPDGGDYSDRVKAMSQAVEKLSREVADAIKAAARK